MVEYHCSLCSYTTIFPSNYKKHIKTKKHLDKEKEYEKSKNNKEYIKYPDAPEMHPDAPKKHPEILDNKTCKFCNKSFTRTTGLKKHLNICSHKNT